MKRLFLCILVFIFSFGVSYAEEKSVLKDKKDRISYSIGVNIGTTFKKQSIDINPDIIIMGIKDVLNDKTPLMNEKEVNEALMELQKEINEKQQAKLKELGEKNKKEGMAFLEENKKKEGVITLSSGLQYRVIKEGEGESPQITDTVTINYIGKLIDGTEFDSSYKRGQPATFRVNGVIKGLSEALQLMKPGSKWEIFVPDELAYGDRNVGMIGPNSTLIFEIELVSFEKVQKFHTDKMIPNHPQIDK